jgi:hypothetical protein
MRVVRIDAPAGGELSILDSVGRRMRGMGIFMYRRTLIGVLLCAGTILTFGATASAGEWAPGHGETPIKTGHVAGSICAFSGSDESDLTEDHIDEDEDGVPDYDDGLWGSTPAKGRAQSPGQVVATFGPGAATPGTDCRGFASAKD